LNTSFRGLIGFSETLQALNQTLIYLISWVISS
jgi:uncharacterized membrane protein YhdT